MNPRVTQVFLEARALSEERRQEYLGMACAHDPELRREVESLLEHDESAARLMPDNTPGRELAGLMPGVLADRACAGATLLPQRLGKYPILGLVGRGGMGLVYRSEQDHPRRPIALKVLRPEFVSPASLKRFHFEVEILGRLRHPGIAQIYEAGTFESELGSQPYFAMELIEGRPLLEHARTLDLGARLELMASIADAVQHAHSQGVVHRDLKPGNILVDSRGAAKVLDFGIARASDADLQATTLVTRGGELLGTLPYMSPEQLAGDPRAIDARSDVYALGVNLYQLLTGRLPLELGQRSLTEALALLREEEPMPLGVHDPALRGDLETIVHKALAKERERRYQTAAELALDLRRHLRHEPILARPAGLLYLLGKFARRNRALVAAAVMTVLTLLVGLAATLVLYQREKAEAARALSLSTLQRLQELREEATGLWPHRHYLRGAMERWIEGAEGLVRELPRLEGHLAELRAEGVLQENGRWEFANDERRWLHDSLARVFAEVSAFADPDPHLGLLAEMRARLKQVEDLVDETAGDHSAEWDALLAVFGDNPRYHGFVLEPQTDLAPLREDPRSGLWEFWHTESGARPELDPATDRWRILPETGLVLILVPGGTFRMGAQSADPALPNFDVNRRPDTVPVREVSVAPFFLSKYEVTQAQWHRFIGTEHDGPGDHPAVQLSWEDCWNSMSRLALPTEAQWECAARAGTLDTWPFGMEYELLARHANIKDQSFARAAPVDEPDSVPWDDSFAGLAPVGSFEPNAFGFHDLFGNAWEWCRDRYGSYVLPVAGTDGERVVPDSEPHRGQRVLRGGSFQTNPSDTTPSARRHAAPDSREAAIGVRPSRMIWRM